MRGREMEMEMVNLINFLNNNVGLISAILGALTIIVGAITIFAIFRAPIVALNIQRKLDDLNEKRSRRINIFKTLMANRMSLLDPENVKALNMVNIEFYDQNDVINAWKAFFDIAVLKDLSDKSNNELFINAYIFLLQKMANLLDFNFNDDEIKNGCYRPNGHVFLENNKIAILTSLTKALSDGKFHVVFDKNHENKKTN